MPIKPDKELYVRILIVGLIGLLAFGIALVAIAIKAEGDNLLIYPKRVWVMEKGANDYETIVSIKEYEKGSNGKINWLRWHDSLCPPCGHYYDGQSGATWWPVGQGWYQHVVVDEIWYRQVTTIGGGWTDCIYGYGHIPGNMVYVSMQTIGAGCHVDSL